MNGRYINKHKIPSAVLIQSVLHSKQIFQIVVVLVGESELYLAPTCTSKAK